MHWQPNFALFINSHRQFCCMLTAKKSTLYFSKCFSAVCSWTALALQRYFITSSSRSVYLAALWIISLWEGGCENSLALTSKARGAVEKDPAGTGQPLIRGSCFESCKPAGLRIIHPSQLAGSPLLSHLHQVSHTNTSNSKRENDSSLILGYRGWHYSVKVRCCG